MSDETTSTQAEPTTQETSTPSAKPSLEQAFAKDKSEFKPRSDLKRPKKLGISSLTEGEGDLSGFSKKAKKSVFEKSKIQDEQEGVLFDQPEPEKITLPKAKEEPKQEKQQKVEVKPQEIQPKPPEKHKVVVNGEERELTVDELKKDYQLRQASYQAFQEASKMRKEYEDFKSNIKDKTKLINILRENGYDPRQLAEEHLAEVLNFELMTPEQKEIAVLRAREAQRNREIQETMQRQAMERAQKESSERASRVEKAIIDVLEANQDIPNDSDTIRLFINHMRARINAQKHLPDRLKEDVSPEMVLEDVKNSIQSTIRAKTSVMTAEQLIAFLGKDKVDELRKYEVAQIKNPIPKAERVVANDQPIQPQKKHYKTMEEWRQNQKANGIKTFY